ncbi:MAG: hypothetical protein JKY27_00200 [Magnetovibrio sp.]|nr:hypothetical protein [Magnetovibrio sp.]
MEIRFTVWQFVRLMVHLEDSAPGQDTEHAAQSALLKAWNDIWQPLDTELGELAKSDFDAYSALMMDRELVIDDATSDQTQSAKKVIEQIMTIMDKAIKADEDPDQLQNLKFERRELRQLSRKLSRMT